MSGSKTERHGLARVLGQAWNPWDPARGLRGVLEAMTADAIAEDRTNIIQFAPRKRKEAAHDDPAAPAAA